MLRNQYVFRGCLLLLAIIVSIAATFLSLIWGKTPDVLNRLGIIFETIGILAVAPDIIGERRLEKVASNVQGFKKTQQYIKEYLYSFQETPSQESQPFLLTLSLLGNFTMSFLLIWLSISLIFSKIQGGWIGIVLLPVSYTHLTLPTSDLV